MKLFQNYPRTRAWMLCSCIVSGFLWGIVNNVILGRPERRVEYEVLAVIALIQLGFILWNLKNVKSLFW